MVEGRDRDGGGAGGRRWFWAARRAAVSVFVVVHCGATLAWVLPPCPARAAVLPAVRYYIMPLGLWQYWGMFAPDPLRDTVTLEADVVDVQGLRATFAFTKVAEYPWWRAVPRFRHSKYAVNLAVENSAFERRLAARHAVRKLGVPPEAFPVDVTLQYQVRPCPPPGQAPDPMAATRLHVLDTIHLTSAEEVWR